MMHTLRLLYSGINILQHSQPMVTFEGESRDYLLAVRRGEFTYEELISKGEILVEEMKALRTSSKIAESVDIEQIDLLHTEILSLWQERIQQ